MTQALALVSLVVRDFDEALNFFVGTLGFAVVEDTYVPEQDKRWIVVAPPGSAGARLLLARASNLEQTEHIGKRTGGRVFFLTQMTSGATTNATKDKGSSSFGHRERSPMVRSPYSVIFTEICGI
jgi:catechol 2,3-dioxygenase-like lactoylglutathione lyase family enzyme